MPFCNNLEKSSSLDIGNLSVNLIMYRWKALEDMSEKFGVEIPLIFFNFELL